MFSYLIYLFVFAGPVLISGVCLYLVPRSASLKMKLGVVLPGVFIGIFMVAGAVNSIAGVKKVAGDLSIIAAALYLFVFPALVIFSAMLFWENKTIRRLQLFNFVPYLLFLFIFMLSLMFSGIRIRN